MRKNITSIFAALLTSTILVSGAAAETVNVFAPAPITAGEWALDDTRPGGASTIVDVTGLGGNLESNAPLGSGVAKLTTNSDSGSKAQVSVYDDFGTIGDFLNGGNISYDFYKADIFGGNAAAAASIKLIVQDFGVGSGVDGFASFVFEAYLNGSNPTTDVWTTGGFSEDSGNVWISGNGIYGVAGGGSILNTMSEWATILTNAGNNFLNANIIGITVGVGSGNILQEAYFDNIVFNSNSGSIHAEYDFEAPSAVPVPAALPLFGTGLAIMGFIGWRRKRKISA